MLPSHLSWELSRFTPRWHIRFHVHSLLDRFLSFFSPVPFPALPFIGSCPALSLLPGWCVLTVFHPLASSLAPLSCALNP